MSQAAVIAWLQAHDSCRGVPLDGATRVVSSGLLDSLAVLELHLWVEQTFGVRLPLVHDDFDRIDGIARLIDGGRPC